ncbi:carboxymuconolactone decarboxylase family protein [Mucilaginibacter paludis]|uniref:Peroxidase family protein n=1 Tax=Mucilaginibacter paludis DSM 18603 TaxID=714943 RepID=H1YCD4_9SPHI|nr:carboxymuconolactone decarboxylase family protein [Mucilaginibacter paludis]EHQ30125.1 peroxidase family protein [Mucilaginibacter paludis DSM 18603]
MAYINLPNTQLPGIVGLFDFRKDTGKILADLAELLLRGPSTLTSGEREIIASSVSYWNDCHFCHTSHAAAAKAHLGAGMELFDQIKAGFPDVEISSKLKALLLIAQQVQKGTKHVLQSDVDFAKDCGADDLEIHDTVLIAAAFCMYNRYVDCLNTWAPEHNEEYVSMGERMAHVGYGKTIRATES